MRGDVKKQSSMLSLRSPAERIPSDHPLRRVKDLADGALSVLSPTFDAMYSKVGRPSIPPERLLKGSLLMALYSVRSERLFCEQLDYNLLFRWFLDMDMEEPSPDHSTFSLNRERLLEHEVAKRFFVAVVEQARKAKLMSNEHFTVDGTLIDAWASLKSFRPKDEEKQKPPDDPGNPTVNFHGEARSNETHASTTDPEARLAKKGHNREARLSYLANALMENRNGLLVDFCIEPADGRAERRSAEQMLERVAQRTRTRLTVGADKGYDAASFIERCRQLGITPHVAQTSDSRRRSAVDGRTARHAGYAVSQRIRKRVEEIFGWMKTVGGFRKTRYRGRDKTQLAAYLVGAAYNLMRIARLQPT
jgi:Transposase and inactivated derivatives